MTDHTAIKDAVVASGLATAPVWAPGLQEANLWLTTISLAIGIALGIARLTVFIMDRRRQRLPDATQDRGDQVSKS
jgi:hypothetical protein